MNRMVRVKSLLLAGALTIGPAVIGQQEKPLPCQTVANKSAADLLQMNTDLTKKISDRENMLRILHKEMTDTELTEDEKQAVNAMDSTVIHLGAALENDFAAERKLRNDAIFVRGLPNTSALLGQQVRDMCADEVANVRKLNSLVPYSAFVSEECLRIINWSPAQPMTEK